jgi:agmatinase
MANPVFDEAAYLELIPYQGPVSFMRQPYSRDLDGVELAVYGIPLDCGTVNRPGARLGPRAIREQSVFIGGLEPLYPHERELRKEFKFIDYGDISFNPGYIGV